MTPTPSGTHTKAPQPVTQNKTPSLHLSSSTGGQNKTPTLQTHTGSKRDTRANRLKADMKPDKVSAFSDNAWLDAKLDALAQTITRNVASQVSDESASLHEHIRKLNVDLTQKVTALEGSLNAHVSHLNERIEDQDKRLKNLETKIGHDVTALEGSLNAQASGIDDRFNDQNARIKDLEARCADIEGPKDSSVNNLSEHLTRIDSLERQLLECDLILNGVPVQDNEDLKALFNSLCRSLTIDPQTITNIFRAKPKRKNTDPSIIIKFDSPSGKNKVLLAAKNVCKQGGHGLSLRNVSFDSDQPIYLQESLTSRNYQIYRAALKLKRKGKVAVVFTKNGRVFVRRTPEDDIQYISSSEDLVDM